MTKTKVAPFYLRHGVVNHVGIFICTYDVQLLKVNFFYVRNYNDWIIFSCGACHRCISI